MSCESLEQVGIDKEDASRYFFGVSGMQTFVLIGQCVPHQSEHTTLGPLSVTLHSENYGHTSSICISCCKRGGLPTFLHEAGINFTAEAAVEDAGQSLACARGPSTSKCMFYSRYHKAFNRKVRQASGTSAQGMDHGCYLRCNPNCGLDGTSCYPCQGSQIVATVFDAKLGLVFKCLLTANAPLSGATLHVMS